MHTAPSRTNLQEITRARRDNALTLHASSIDCCIDWQKLGLGAYQRQAPLLAPRQVHRRTTPTPMVTRSITDRYAEQRWIPPENSARSVQRVVGDKRVKQSARPGARRRRSRLAYEVHQIVIPYFHRDSSRSSPAIDPSCPTTKQHVACARARFSPVFQPVELSLPPARAMRNSMTFAAKAWHGAGFAQIQPRIHATAPATLRSLTSSSLSPILSRALRLAPPQTPSLAALAAGTARNNALDRRVRFFSASRALLEAKRNATPSAKPRKSYKQEMADKGVIDVEEHEGEAEDMGFVKSDKATAAAKVNLSAKLSKEGATANSAGGMKEMWRLIKIASPESKSLGFAFIFLLLSSAVSMSVPFSIGKILDIATQSEGSNELLFGMDINTFYAALAAVLATGAACNFGRIIILRVVGERIVARLRSQLYRKTFIQNAEFFDANRVGDLISRLGSDTIIVGKAITQNLSDGLRSMVAGAAGFAMMGYVSLKLTGILATIGPLIAVSAFVAGRQLRNLSRKIQKNLGTLTKVAEERLGNVRTAQAFAGEVTEAGRYNRQIKRIFALGKKEAYVAATFFGVTGLMGNLTIIAVLYVGGGMVKSGAITIGELSSFLMYTAYAGSSMVGLSGFWGEMMKGVGAASRLFELQDRNPTLSPTKGFPVKSARGPIEFKNVTFSYPTRPAVNIFKDLNFKIEQGMNVAIVAPSGAGKSTVASLLLRFYVPTEGTILIDGRDITTLNAKQLRRKIGFVGQEPVLFSGTIAENIAYGVPNATRAEIIAAARKANCTFISDFVRKSWQCRNVLANAT